MPTYFYLHQSPFPTNLSWGWNKLPNEIRWMIINYTRGMIYPWDSADCPEPQLSLVSREWNVYFRCEKFRLLVLDQGRLDSFRRIIDNSAIKFVQRIVLHIKLPGYGCDVCQQPEDKFTTANNDAIFARTLRRFMNIMSSFDAESHPGIILDLGVSCSSDGQHTFREYRSSQAYRYGASQEAYNRHFHEIEQSRAEVGKDPYACPGWKAICANPTTQPAWGAVARTTATLGSHREAHFDEVFRANFTPAPIISCLILRRQYNRHISPVMLGGFIRQGLPNLRNFRHEVPEHAGLFEMDRFYTHYIDIIESLPDSLEHLTTYQEPQNFLRIQQGPEWYRNFAWWHPALRLIAEIVTVRATQLTSVCSTLAIDANIFANHAAELDLEFPKLEWMALTSSLLQQRVPVSRLARLIFALALIAFYRMPKLKVLVLWEGKIGNGFFMRFRFGPNRHVMLIDFYSSHYRIDEIFHMVRAIHGQIVTVDPLGDVILNNMWFDPALAPFGSPTNFPGVQEGIIDPESSRQIRFEAQALRIN